MSSKNRLILGYALFKRGKLLKTYRTKEALLKAIGRIPLKQRRAIKLKTYLKFSLVK